MPANSPNAAAPATWKEKASAVSVFLATTGLFYYIANRPLADPVDTAEAHQKLKAESNDALVLRPLAAPDAGPLLPLLSVLGEENEAIDVHFTDGALAAATAAELRQDFGIDLPATRGTIAWTTSGKGNGRTRIDVSLKPVAGGPGSPEVQIRHAGSRNSSGLRMETRNAVAVVRFSVLLGGDPSAGAQTPLAADQNTLTLAGARAVPLPGAWPITVVAGEAGAVTLLFPVGQPKSGFYLGGPGGAEPGDGTDPGIFVRDIGVRRPNATYKWHACAANEGALFFWPRALRASDCATTSTLRAHDLTVTPTHVELQLNGTAYVIEDGAARTADWLARLERYKLPSALLGLVYAALAKWVWQVFARGRGVGT